MRPGQHTPLRAGKRRRGRKPAKAIIHEQRIPKAVVPPGSRFKGYESVRVQDLILRTHTIRYRRERWLMPDGTTVIAPLPDGMILYNGKSL